MAETKIEPNFPLARTKKMMKAHFPEGLISKESIEEMDRTLGKIVENITKKAGKIALNGKRKTITAADIDIACE
jgi:histone H3/H4